MKDITGVYRVRINKIKRDRDTQRKKKESEVTERTR